MLELWATLGIVIPLLADATELRPGQVELSGPRFHALTAEPERPPRHAWARSRELDLTVEPEGLRIHGRWTLHAERATYFAGDLLPIRAHLLRATWNGKPAGLWRGERGPVVVGWVEEPVTLEVDAFLPGASDSAELELLEAVAGTVRVHSPTPLRVTASDGSVVLRDGDRFVTGAGALRLAAPVAGAVDSDTVAFATAGIGLTVDDAAVETRARVIFTVRRGALARLTLQATGFGSDLDVTGPNVASFARRGDELAIELRAPVTTTTTLELTATTPIPSGAESALPLPGLASADAFRFESALTLARTGEVDAVPNLTGGAPLAVQALPEWASGLVTGTPTAAFRLNDGGAAGRLDCFRFVPVPAPPVRVEIADLRYVTAADGATLLRARYEVTNERAAVLEVRPPRGAQPVGAWVAGREVPLGVVGNRLRIPLKRSVETADGLLTFPVVLVLAAPGERWSRREERDLPLPVVAAPVSVTQITVGLPRGYRSLLEPGERAVVHRFTRSEEVGFGLADDAALAQADALYADALDAWNRNDFSRAEQRLSELDALGAASTNQYGLASNLALLRPPTTPEPAGSPGSKALGPAKKSGTEKPSPAPPADAQSRRIRAQARARATDHKTKQRAAQERARVLRDQGEYDAAAAEYEQALEATEQLYQLDEDESASNAHVAAELEGELEAVQAAKAQRQELESAAKTKLWSGGPFGGGFTPAPAAAAPPLAPAASIPLPNAGEAVRYELLLLEPGAERSVHLVARRRRDARAR